MIRQEHVDLLDAFHTGEHAHSGRTLRDHLIGTYRLLEAWGNPEDVCVAGLFHSVYGTEFYRTRSADLSQRERIRCVIGERAEWLAYLFCACDRNHLRSNAGRAGDYTLKDLLRGEELPLDERTLRELLEIETANVLDQLPAVEELPIESRTVWRERWYSMQRFLSVSAFAAVLAYFDPVVERRDSI